jgi:hypothetical protein
MILVRKPEGKRPLGRPRCRWVHIIKMDLREIWWDGTGWINLALWTVISIPTPASRNSSLKEYTNHMQQHQKKRQRHHQKSAVVYSGNRNKGTNKWNGGGKFKCCAKQRMYIYYLPRRNHLPQTWKSVYVVKFEVPEVSEFDPNSANMFLGTWNISNTVQYNVWKMLSFE